MTSPSIEKTNRDNICESTLNILHHPSYTLWNIDITNVATKVTITSIREESGSIKIPICICNPLKLPNEGMLSQSTVNTSWC